MALLKDIAKKAQVNIGSVSHVLNNHPKALELRLATRERILSAARELGYQRNELARSIVTGRSGIIAVFCTMHGYLIDMLKGIADSCNSAKLSIKLLPYDSDKRLREGLTQAISYRVDGVIGQGFTQRQVDILHEVCADYVIPTVITNDLKTTIATTTVQTNQVESAKLAVEYLIQSGHQRIVCGFPGKRAYQRKIGYSQVMQQHGLEPVFFNQQQIDAIIDYQPDAVFCTEDPCAFALLQRAYQRNIRIPDCFSVVGFGGVKFIDHSAPKLTTVAESFYEIGQAMVNALQKHMSGSNEIEHIQIPAKLVVRESTAINKDRRNK